MRGRLNATKERNDGNPRDQTRPIGGPPGRRFFFSKTQHRLFPHTLNIDQYQPIQQKYGNGDFSVQLSPNLGGIDGQIALAFNQVIRNSSVMVSEFERVSKAVGEVK